MREDVLCYYEQAQGGEVMAVFKTAYDLTNHNEGGYANNPNDAGGETYRGIARKFHPRWPGWTIVDQVKKSIGGVPPFGEDGYRPHVVMVNSRLRGMSVISDMVEDFYRDNFWDANLIGEIDNQEVANWLYDHIVNAGSRGAKWLQEAAGVLVDGDIGPKSIEAFNAANPAVLLENAKKVAGAYRLDKVRRDPSQKQFLHSWLSRDGFDEGEIKDMIANV